MNILGQLETSLKPSKACILIIALDFYFQKCFIISAFLSRNNVNLKLSSTFN